MSGVWQWLQGTATSAVDIIGGVVRGREAGKVELEKARSETAIKTQAEITKQKMYVALGATAVALVALLVIVRKK